MDDVNEDGCSSGSCCRKVQSDDSDGRVNLYNRLRDDELVIILCVMRDVLCFVFLFVILFEDRAQIQCKICILYSND